MNRSLTLPLVAVFGLVIVTPAPAQKPVTLLNVSYDPTRELYQDFSAAFTRYWKENRAGRHDPAVPRGLGVTGARRDRRSWSRCCDLALSGDIDQISTGGLIPADWQSRLPHNSTPIDHRLPGAQGTRSIKVGRSRASGSRW
jgi:sulfate transport system substrate-binding protein